MLKRVKRGNPQTDTGVGLTIYAFNTSRKLDKGITGGISGAFEKHLLMENQYQALTSTHDLSTRLKFLLFIIDAGYLGNDALTNVPITLVRRGTVEYDVP